MSALEVHDVHAGYGSTPVLHGVDLVVPAGSITVLVGQSGSGKTTLLRILAGFERPTSGTVRIGDRVVDGPGTWVTPQRRQLGWVAQDGALFPHLDVAGNVAFGLPRSQRRTDRVAQLVEMVGLGPFAHRYPHQLSGGQQQRVALARALAVEPEAVLLDEPFSSLDPGLRTQVRADVLDVLRRAGTTTLLVSHDRDEALSVADRIALLRNGRIVATGTPDQLYGLPPDPDTASFVGDANLIDGVVGGPGDDGAPSRSVATAFGRLDLIAGQPSIGGGTTPAPVAVAVLVRPEQLRLVGPGGAPSTAAVGDASSTVAGGDASRTVAVGDASSTVAGTVVSVEYHGHDTMIRVQVGPEVGIGEMVVRALGRPAWGVGDRVGLHAAGPVTAWTR